MRLILLKFVRPSYIPALSKLLDEYTGKICIAHKHSATRDVYIFTSSQAVINLLNETNPNCVEIPDAVRFIEKKLHKFQLSNPVLLEDYTNHSIGIFPATAGR